VRDDRNIANALVRGRRFAMIVSEYFRLHR
jgi:hypothetical protein